MADPPQVDPTGETAVPTLTETGDPLVSADPDGRIGRNFAHFRVEKRLGAGGMGEVYLADDLALERKVALKFLARDVAENPRLRERFLREARAQARLNHPNIGHIYFVGEAADHQLFFAMEYIEGESLQQRLDRAGKIPAPEALELCRQAALGLREAHRQGFTHRDVKPSNLMVDRNGMVKLVDFGIVKPAEEAESRPALTHDKGALLGTPHYMAPEQARGDAVDFRADIYSLGATLHHLIAGRPPFEAPTAMGVVSKHLAEPRPVLQKTHRFGLSSADLVLEKMMAKKPEDRFASYDDLVAAMERLSPVSSRPAGFWARAFALGLDVMFVGLLQTPFQILFGGDTQGAPILVIGAIYSILAHARWGRTLGKALLEIEVIDIQRSGQLGLKRAAIRWLYQWGPCYSFIGLAIVVELWRGNAYGLPVVAMLTPVLFGLFTAFTPGKRAWWDRQAGTLVRYRR